MRRGPGPALGAVLVAALAVVACTNAYLYDERRSQTLPTDRSLAVEGRFCTPSTNQVLRPIKILIALDTSQSMNANDPDGTRAQATVDLISSLPDDDEIFIDVMLFAGSVPTHLTNGQQAGFVKVKDLRKDPSALYVLEDQILNLTNVVKKPNRDSTDFVKPLAEIYAVINEDIATGRANPSSSSAEARARYSVIFLSDGHPSQDQDEELISDNGQAVRRIRNLKDLVEDVRFNTVHVFNPVQPVSSSCDLSGDAGSPGCPLLIITQDSERLETMASIGGGDFRDFRNHEPINFLNFDFGATRRTYLLKEWVATNRNALADSPLVGADSDGDGLSDADEAKEGTNPLVADTDGDGFSDGVEVHFRALGAPFNPVGYVLPDGGGGDVGCPPSLRGVDSDCDGVLDCDEQIIGTNAKLADSDGDGMPDALEWQLGTEGASKDLDEDPDSDGLTNRSELRLHHDPHRFDTANLSVDGYRYQLEADGAPDTSGSQCFKFRVDNISLASTLRDTQDGGTGRGAGFNEVDVSFATIPADDPTAATVVKTFRYKLARFPVAGIKLPVDGVIHAQPGDFIEGCPKTGAGANP